MNPTNFVYWLSGILSTCVSYSGGISSDDTKKIIEALESVRTEPMNKEGIFMITRDE